MPPAALVFGQRITIERRGTVALPRAGMVTGPRSSTVQSIGAAVLFWILTLPSSGIAGQVPGAAAAVRSEAAIRASCMSGLRGGGRTPGSARDLCGLAHGAELGAGGAGEEDVAGAGAEVHAAGDIGPGAPDGHRRADENVAA